MAASRSHAQWLVLLALCSLATAALSLEAGQDRKCANHEPTLDEEDAVCALQRAPLKQGGEKKALVKQHTAESAVMVQSSRAVAKAGAKTMVDKKKSTASKQGRFPWGWTGSNDSPGGDDEAVYDPQKDNEEEAVYDPTLDNEAEAVYDPTLDNEEEAVYNPKSDDEADKEAEAVYDPTLDNEAEAVYDPTLDNEAEAVYDPKSDNEEEAVYDPQSDNEEEAVYDPQSDNEAEAVYDPKKDDDEAVAGNTWMAKLHSLGKGVASKAAPKAASAV